LATKIDNEYRLCHECASDGQRDTVKRRAGTNQETVVILFGASASAAGWAADDKARAGVTPSPFIHTKALRLGATLLHPKLPIAESNGYVGDISAWR
jgi:hypothetical protein